MLVLVAGAVGALFAAGFYLLLRRSMVRVVAGLVLMGQATNLLVFSAGGLLPATPPILPEGGPPAYPISDPLPQALILTAIVINFGMLAFAALLVRRAHADLGTDDLDALGSEEP